MKLEEIQQKLEESGIKQSQDSIASELKRLGVKPVDVTIDVWDVVLAHFQVSGNALTKTEASITANTQPAPTQEAIVLTQMENVAIAETSLADVAAYIDQLTPMAEAGSDKAIEYLLELFDRQAQLMRDRQEFVQGFRQAVEVERQNFVKQLASLPYEMEIQTGKEVEEIARRSNDFFRGRVDKFRSNSRLRDIVSQFGSTAAAGS